MEWSLASDGISGEIALGTQLQKGPGRFEQLYSAIAHWLIAEC